MNFDCFPGGCFPLNHAAAAPSLIGDGWLGDETERFFRGRSLTDVNHRTLSSEYKEVWWAAHNYLNDEAYLFFLPAFMRVALFEFDKDGSPQLADALAYGFLRMADGQHDDRLLPIMKNYTKNQLKGVAEFLFELSRDRYGPSGDIDDARPALDLFWSRYLS